MWRTRSIQKSPLVSRRVQGASSRFSLLVAGSFAIFQYVSLLNLWIIEMVAFVAKCIV